MKLLDEENALQLQPSAEAGGHLLFETAVTAGCILKATIAGAERLIG